MGASDFRCAVGSPPGVPVVPPYPHGFAGALAVGPSDRAFHVANHVGTHDSLFITGLNPFTRAHGSPSAPCVRFMSVVTFGRATLGIRCLAKASGAGIYPRLTGPSFARRSSKWTKVSGLERGSPHLII